MTIGITLLSLVFIFQQSSSFIAFAQDEPAGAPTPPAEAPEELAPTVSSEAQAQAEAALATSAEALQEIAIDLPAELNLEGYDPLVKTDGFFGNVVYQLKENVLWPAQEGLSEAFASESSHAALVYDHANKGLIAAAKVYAADPKESREVLDILQNYQGHIDTFQSDIKEIKEAGDATTAKALAAEVASTHIFTVPKVLGTMQDAYLAISPEIVPALVEVKNEVLGAAGNAVVAAADNEQEVAQALSVLASQKQATAFSGIANAEVLSQVKEQLGPQVSETMAGVFDEVITTQLKTVEENLKTLQASDEVKSETFKNYVEQLPGHNLERMKVIDEFKSQTALPPIFIEKCNEIKARVAAAIGAKIKQVVQEEIRKAVSEAMLQIATPGIEDFRVLQEFQDLVPDEEIKQQITQNHEASVQKFLARFGDDANAQAVTAEFDTLVKKMQAGQVTPDANFFKTLEGLKNRLSPDQQRFIDNMENTGKQEMVNRMQDDVHFAERFSSFNPADMQVFEKFRTEGFGPQFGPPPGFNFEDKFRAIERQQAQNFGRFLEFQNRPEDVQSIQQRFESFVPEDIRSRFEAQYNFNDQAFRKHEEFAREKEVFFQQKFEQIQKEYQEKFGSGSQEPGGFTPPPFPGGSSGTPFPFPGGPGFPFPGSPGFGGFGPGFPPPFFQPPGGEYTGGPPPGYLGPPIREIVCQPPMVQGPYGCIFSYPTPSNIGFICAPGFVPTAFGCEPHTGSYPTPSGGCPPGAHWVSDPQSGGYCSFGDSNIPPPSPIDGDPAAQCNQYGGTWKGDYCDFSRTISGSCGPGAHWVAEPTNPSGGYCAPDSYPTPSVYPSPTYTTPSGDRSADCSRAGGTWSSDGYCHMPNNYVTPGPGVYTYPTPGVPYSTPGTYPSPTPGGCAPGTYCPPSYTTPYSTPTGDPATDCAKNGGTWTGTYCSYPYATPYPSPSTSYPTPGYAYPTPGEPYAYPTPGVPYGTPYPTPGTYPYPTPGVPYSTPSTSYPTPSYAYPTPSYAYPTPGQPYPTPSYPYPTPGIYAYPTPGVPYSTPSTSYPTPGYAYPTPGTAYPTPSYAYPTPAYAYPTPGEPYPTPSYTYPTPSTSYPTPSYAYPTPSTSYPTPGYAYPTPSTSYPTPSYAYPTPSTSYPTPSYAYPTPSYAYPTPTEYPTPAYAYPTPAYAYPTPSYATPTGYAPNPQVAGSWIRIFPHERSIFDLLAFIGLGVYGYYMGKRK